MYCHEENRTRAMPSVHTMLLTTCVMKLPEEERERKGREGEEEREGRGGDGGERGGRGGRGEEGGEGGEGGEGRWRMGVEEGMKEGEREK